MNSFSNHDDNPFNHHRSLSYCNYCPGYCCYRLEGSVLLLTATDINRLARHFSISDGEVRKRYLENKYTFKVRKDGSCIFQATDKMMKRCSIHEARPDQCRRFPYGKPCPYLEREDLLKQIQPLVEDNLRLNCCGKERDCFE